MTIGRPCVEREHGAQHAKSHKGEREQIVLPLVRNSIVVRYLQQVHRQGLSLGRAMEINANETQHQEGRTTHEHEGEFHGTVVLVATTPHTNEQVHGNERHLVEHEHGEQVYRDEEAKHTCREQEEPQEELLGQRVHLPRGKHASKDDECRQKNHHHAHAVHSQGEFDVHRFIPGDRRLEQHFARVAGTTQMQEQVHQVERKSHQHCGASDCNRTNGGDALVVGQGQPSKCEHWHYHEIDEYVVKYHHSLSFINKFTLKSTHTRWWRLPR